MFIQAFLLVVTTVAFYYFRGFKRRKLPPGPLFRLPILGHLPFLDKIPSRTFQKWSKRYGPIFFIQLGSYPCVVISGTQLIRDAMNMSCFSGRPKLNLFTSRSSDGIPRGIIVSDGSQWTEQRRFALKNLRNFGFGTKTMEEKVQEEIDGLMDWVSAREGKPIQVKSLFNFAVLNALWSITFGERMMEGDPDSIEAFRGLTEVFENGNPVSLAMFLPWFAKIAPKLSGFEKMVQGIPNIKASLRKQIVNHNENYVPNQPRDFLDAYTDEVKKTTDPNSSFHVKNKVMLYSLIDLFAGGAETTSTTLSWLCAYLIHHTKVQKKLQDEIDKVVGRQRIASLTDRPSMPYTEAVINEVMRFSSIFPYSVLHSATEDLEFHGFFIPNDTMILPNLYGNHFDETIWGDPENFRPERFIDSNGKFKKNENLLPFSFGKRVCLGESFARDEMFLFTANLFQKYSASADKVLPSLDPHMGFTLSPQPFEIILKNRLK